MSTSAISNLVIETWPYTVHELKTVQPYFDAVSREAKTFEVRKDDRGFQPGDRRTQPPQGVPVSRAPMVEGEPYSEEIRSQLAGRDLACWCPLDLPCHGDVLLELANGGSDDR